MGKRGPKPKPAMRRENIVKLRLHDVELTALIDQARAKKRPLAAFIRDRLGLARIMREHERNA